MYWKWFNDDFTLSLGLIMMLANPSVTVLGIYAYNQLYWTFFYMQNGFAIKSLNGKKCANKNTDLICIDNDKWILIHPRFPLTLIKKCLCAYNCLTFTTTFIWLLATVFFLLIFIFFSMLSTFYYRLNCWCQHHCWAQLPSYANMNRIKYLHSITFLSHLIKMTTRR